MQDPDTSGPKDLHTEILKQRSCTSCPTGSWYRDLSKGSSHRDPETEILHKLSHRILIQRSVQRILTQRSWNRDLAQVVPQDLDTEISHKCAYRILMQWAKRSCCRDLAQVGSWYKWSKGSFTQRSWNRDLAQVVPQDLDTEISHKCAYRIVIQWAKRSYYRDLAQVLLQDPDTSGPKDHSHRDPETEILHKLFYRILIQRSCASGPRGSWHKRSESILIRDLVQVVL